MNNPIEGDLTVRYIFESIEKIADKIGLTAQELWPYMVKQVYIDGMVGLIFTCLLIFASLFVAVRYGAYGDMWEKSEDGGKVCAVLPLIVIGICIAAIFFAITPRLLNPEYFAFEKFMHMIK